MPAPQSFKNHTRWDPLFHFFLMPLSLANLIVSISAAIHHRSDNPSLYAWWIVMSLVFLVAVFNVRRYGLAVQDRVIRLEERIRLAALLAPSELARSRALTDTQLVGLRFASDAELPALVDRTLAENLTRKQIKEAIVTWRPDNHRV